MVAVGGHRACFVSVAGIGNSIAAIQDVEGAAVVDRVDRLIKISLTMFRDMRIDITMHQ